MVDLNNRSSRVDPGRAVTTRLCLVVLIITCVLPLSGCEEGSNVTDEQYQTTEEEYIVISLGSPFVHKRTEDAGDTWDVTLDITDINPNTAMVPWLEVRVSVKGADGSLLVTATIPSQDGGLYGTEPEVWYQEISGSAERVSVGDAIRVTSMSQDFEGATVQVTRQGEVLATATLPGTFW